MTIKLKEILKERNMTMTELHEKTRISQSALSLLANHKNKGVQFETLEKIASALDVHPTNLFKYKSTTKHRYFISAQIKYTDWKFGFGHYEVESDFKIIDLEGIELSLE